MSVLEKSGLNRKGRSRVVPFLARKRGQNEKLPKNVQKVSQNAFWGFLAASQKNVPKVSGKCPGAGVGAGKMSRKCQKNVPQTLTRHFFDTSWQIENQKGARARAKRARPLLGGGRRPPLLFAKKCPFWFFICQKVSKKCLENVWGTLF